VVGKSLSATLNKRRVVRRRKREPDIAPAPVAAWDSDLFDLGHRIADRLDPPENPYMREPVGWIHNRLGEETWSKQDEILTSIVENRKTAIWSCHSSGKSHIASRAASWWIDTHPIDDVFIVSTAPSAPQVRGILWRYVGDAHRKGQLGGYITNGEIPEWKIDGRLVGWGRKPASLTNEEAAKAVFQGIHAKYVLVILDEADGVPKWLFDAVTTLVTSPTNRVLAIGNPDDPNSHFASIRKDPEATWNKIKISAFDCPWATGEPVSENLEEHLISEEWVNEAKHDWGEENPLYISKVLAEYPDVGDDALITPAMINKAIAAWEELDGTALGRYAMDVARLGKDKTVIYRNRGGVVEKVTEWSKKDTAETTDRAAALLEPHQGGVPMVIDIGGLGSGPFDNLRKMDFPVFGFDGSTKPWSDDRPRPDGLRFLNRRAEQYWGLREEMDRGALGLDPKNLKAQAQLMNIKWDRTATGRIFIEKKEEISKRVGHSPDDADTIMMSTVETDEWELVSQARNANKHREPTKARSHTSDLMGRKF
jgi:hypothetical protein